MTPEIHTLLATSMLAAAYYIGRWFGSRQGIKEGAVEMIVLFAEMGYGDVSEMVRDLEKHRDRDTDE
jgi:hypothetical protein